MASSSSQDSFIPYPNPGYPATSYPVFSPESLARIAWVELSFRPLIRGMPKNGEPVKPEVPIETVDTLVLSIH